MGPLVAALSLTGPGCSRDPGGSGGVATRAGGNGGHAGGGAGGQISGGSTCDYGGASAGTGTESGELQIPWDWAGVVGTGQSLAVGEQGRPIRSREQPYGNLKLSTGTAPWPVDPEDETLEMVPLVEPVGRQAPSYPSSWPENIAGETIHSSMGNQITALVQQTAARDYVSVQGQFGENGQCLSLLDKDATETGLNGRAYAATLLETRAITRLATAAGKSYGVGAITVVHGECDAGNASYGEALLQLHADYDGDLRAITGQSQPLQMLVSQQNSTGNRAASTLAQWRLGLERPADFACVGPTYQYESADGTHLVSRGYQQLGEKFGQVYFERVVRGRRWQPLQPLEVRRSGRVITVRFHVPVPPLVWDTALQSPHQSSSAWAAGKGFEVRAGTTNVTISAVDIDCADVNITVEGELPETDLAVSYALYGESNPRAEPVMGTRRWGLLRDSDPFVGSSTGIAQPNYAVAFELPVP